MVGRGGIWDDTRRARGERKGWKERKWNEKRVQWRRWGKRDGSMGRKREGGDK